MNTGWPTAGIGTVLWKRVRVQRLTDWPVRSELTGLARRVESAKSVYARATGRGSRGGKLARDVGRRQTLLKMITIKNHIATIAVKDRPRPRWW